MSKIPILMTSMALNLTLQAQNPNLSDSLPDDSLMLQNLMEVVVFASPVVHKADRDVYTPSKQARQASPDGLALLQNMNIPSLSVNTLLNTVSNPGGSVQLRINGREVGVQDVLNLSAENVVKVEYLENPGLRYKDVNAVINIIVKNPSSGGSVSLSTMLWCKELPSGNYIGNIKINKGKSQWSAYTETQIRDHVPMHRDYDEVFHFSDGQTLKRVESPIGGEYNNNQIWSGLSYSYINPSKTTLWTGVRMNYQNPNTLRYEGMLETVSGTENESHYLSSTNLNMFVRPTFEFYLDHKIGHGQTLALNATASYRYGKPGSRYTESEIKGTNLISDITTSIIDNNLGFSLEGNYMKEWRTASVTGGIKWNGSRNRSKYVSSGNSIFHQRHDALYFFGEYTHRIKNVSITAGTGVQYTDLYMRESDRGTTSWEIQPKISLMWRKDWSTLRAGFTRTSTAPTLGETNPVVQQLDPIQYQYGNPDLKPYSWFRYNLSWSITIPRANFILKAKIRTVDNPIYKYSYWEDNRLMKTYSNDGSYFDFGFNFATSIEAIPEWLFLEGDVGFSRQFTKGKNFRHEITAWGGSAQVMVRHWGFNFLFSLNQASNSLWAQKINRPESFNTIMLQYRWKDYTAGGFVLMPFGRYNQEETSLDANYSYTSIMRSPFVERMVGIQFAATLKWGKQKREVNKLIEGSDDVEGSTAGGR